MGATLIDSLDTLWLMGLRREFARARTWVAAELDFDRCSQLSALPMALVRLERVRAVGQAGQPSAALLLLGRRSCRVCFILSCYHSFLPHPCFQM